MPETRSFACSPPAVALRTALEGALNDVLERMFFVEPECAGPESCEPGIEACLRFEGEMTGWLRLCASAAAARGLASDFLGAAEEDLAESTVQEVLCELANMICGAVLSRVKPNAAIRLGSPRIVEGECSPAANVTSCSVETGRGIVAVTLSTEEPVCLPDEKPAS